MVGIRRKMIYKRFLLPWILYLASCIFLVSAEASAENIRVSILSLLTPRRIKLTLQSPATGMVNGKPWLAGKPFEIESSNGGLKSTIGLSASQIHIDCSNQCAIRIEIADQMDRI